MPPANSAFTSVAARQNLSQTLHPEPVREPVRLPSAPSPMRSESTIPTPEKRKRDWPEPVRQYVQRAFATDNALPGISRQEMETKLKQIISESAESNTLHIVAWDTLPLPQQIISEERAKVSIPPMNVVVGNNMSAFGMQATNLETSFPPTRKRKSGDLEPATNAHHGADPPWRNANSRNIFEDRISFPDKRQQIDSLGKGLSKSHLGSDNRKKRFENGPSAPIPNRSLMTPKSGSPDMYLEQGPVVGQCQNLEKKYFRLTAPPNPETVRPLRVLEKTLDHLKRKWKQENNYSYICDQFKSLRQDLTVQHTKNEFTVNVYEIHARIALEKGDLGEYNQCQTQLRALYSQKLGGHPAEFLAYRILYFIHTSNRTDMNDLIADLTPAEKSNAAVQHALEARSALALGNYHRFFQLYLETPNMGAYLMDIFVPRERLAALCNICRSWVFQVAVHFFSADCYD